MLREADRLLRPGAIFGVFGYSICRLEGDADVVLQHYHTKTLGPHWHPSRCLLDEQYAHFRFEDGNFETVDDAIVEHHVQMPIDYFMGYLATSSAHKSLLESGEADPLPLLEKAIRDTDVLNDADELSVTFPFIVKIGVRKASSH